MTIGASKFLVATTNRLLCIDLKERELQTVHEGSGLYYGISFYNDCYYVAARCNRNSYSNKNDEAGVILVFNNRLQCINTLHSPFPLRDIHGIAHCGGKLWITCTFDNFVAIYDHTEDNWSKWYPLPENRENDINHFNTLHFDEYRGYLIAHNLGVSELITFDPASLSVLESQVIGHHCHSIFDNDEVLYCDSARGLVRSLNNSFLLRLGGFTRGLAAYKNNLLVGISEFTSRDERHDCESYIAIVNFLAKSKEYIPIPNSGMVTEIVGICTDDQPSLASNSTTLQPCSSPPIAEQKLQYDLTLDNQHWHKAEEYRWMGSKRASVSLWQDSIDRRIEVHGYTAEDDIELKIYMGDNLQISKLLDFEGKFSIAIPLPDHSLGSTTLNFEVSNLWHNEPDGRLLGVAIRSLKYFQ